MKRLAVLIHGQPRFINYTWKFIKEEYTIPNIETYYFAHMWKDIGYCPKDGRSDVKDYEKLNLAKNVEKDLTTLKIDNSELLDDVIRNFHPKIREIMLDKHISIVDWKILKLRYQYGQHVSRQEAYKLLTKYEDDHNIIFDIVVIIKTDHVYKNKQCYSKDSEYESVKENLYADVDRDSNLFKNIGGLYKEFKNFANCGAYDLGQTFVDLGRDGKEIQIKYKNKYDRLQLCDHWMLCSRDTAHIYCEQWFDTVLELAKELRQLDIGISNSEKLKFGSYRHLELIGELLVRNNINLIRISRRFKRIINPKKCRPKYLGLRPRTTRTRAIHCRFQDIETEQQYIQNKLLEW